MTNKEELQNWYENEKSNNSLVDIKFFTGEISTLSEETFCASVMVALSLDIKGNSNKVEEL
jgi:hypothetical protein